tara:strand:- start:22 stop:210 length:189 start_codon:yes stop_codon:yes gene_type:complete
MKTKCEVYSRIVGYLRPVQQWNEGKVSEFKDRKCFRVSDKNSCKKVVVDICSDDLQKTKIAA